MRSLKTQNINTNIIPLFVVATFGLHLLTFLILMFHSKMLQQVKKKSLPETLVQLADGRAIAVDAQKNFQRNPRTIQRFVGETMTLMFTSSDKLPTKVVWQISSQLLSEKYQQTLKSQNKSLYLENELKKISKGKESVFIINNISPPVEISPGKWKVQISARRLIFRNYDKLGSPITFNKQILVRSLEKTSVPVPKFPTPLSLAVHRLGYAKLEIYNICEIQNKDCS
ncbi:MAG: hypothetical protein AAF378_07365 [Cyanobacteria bacterium P01_A01_bin.84]